MIVALNLVLLLLGTFFGLVAAVGLLRMPDVLMRMHAATKAGTLGAGLLLLSVGLASGELAVALRALATIGFLFLTAPVAAHAIGRAAYRSGQVRLWEGTFVDEFAPHARGTKDDRTDAPAGAGGGRRMP